MLLRAVLEKYKRRFEFGQCAGVETADDILFAGDDSIGVREIHIGAILAMDARIAEDHETVAAAHLFGAGSALAQAVGTVPLFADMAFRKTGNASVAAAKRAIQNIRCTVVAVDFPANPAVGRMVRAENIHAVQACHLMLTAKPIGAVAV